MADVKVLVVEDHIMARMGVSLVLEKAEGIKLIGECGDGQEGVDMAFDLFPDVILMDIGLPTIDGIEATKKIKDSHPDIKILMCTSRESESDALSAFQAGANGYIMKGATPEQTISAIKTVANGAVWIDPQIAQIVLSFIQSSPKQSVVEKTVDTINYDAGKELFGLTEREMDVLKLLAEGASNDEIGKRLFVAVSTVKAHVHSVLQKLNVSGEKRPNRLKAVNFAKKEGLI